MFKKAGDNVHYLERTGSHSTKGSRRGVDHMAPMGSEDFNSEENIKARRRRIRELRKTISAEDLQAEHIRSVLADAAEKGNSQLVDAIRPVLWDLNEKIKLARSERAELKRVTPKGHHPGRRPDHDEYRMAKRISAMLRHLPDWWDGATDRRKKKYLAWLDKLTKQNITGK